MRSAGTPTTNLIRTLRYALKHKGEPINIIDELLEKLPRDSHGNVLFGLDGNSFQLWNEHLLKVIPFKVFGPIFMPTNPAFIEAVLKKLKNDPDSFVGNASSDLIGDLTGRDTIFAANDSQLHLKQKGYFKHYIEEKEQNVLRIGEIVDKWLSECLEKNSMNDAELEWLCAQIMARMLVDKVAAEDRRFLAGCIRIKNYFIDNATFQSNKHTKKYEKAKDALDEIVERLYSYNNDSFPRYLHDKGCTLETAQHEIRSLMMVGFDNLRGALSVLLSTYAKHPEVMSQLRKDVLDVHGFPFLKFDANDCASGQFFKEATRLLPPVWLQARKNGKNPLDIHYTENGLNYTCTLPGQTLVLIPVYHLAHQLDDGDNFILDRKAAAALDLPFSTGPNACPGRNIGYAASGLLFGALVKQNILIESLDLTKLSPKVSLTVQNLNLRFYQGEAMPILAPVAVAKAPAPVSFGLCENEIEKAITQRYIFNTFMKFTSPAVTFGAGAALAYYATESYLASLASGLITAGLTYWGVNEALESSSMQMQKTNRRLG